MDKAFRCTFVIVIAVTLALLAACSAEGSPSASPGATASAPSPSATLLSATPTETLPPTAALLPTATHWVTATRRATVRPTDAATMTPVFPYIASLVEYTYGATPTPIATPADGAQNYRLKAWSEANAIDLVRLADQYALAADVMGFQDSRPYLSLVQEAIQAAVQEALLRYPDSVHRQALWGHLAMANAIMGKPEMDQWVLGEIERGLNESWIDPGDMNSFLNQMGFKIYGPSLYGSPSVSDLFGVGCPGYIFALEAQTSALYHAILWFAVGQDESGRYHVELIDHFSRGVRWDNYHEVGDHTGDKLPEIVFSYFGSFGYPAGMYIYQWQGDHFTEITGGGFDLTSWIDFLWEYGPPDVNVNGTIEITLINVGYENVFIYGWNGEQYQLISSRKKNTDFIDPGQIGEIIAQGDYITAENRIHEYLAPGLIDSRSGPNFPNFLRFQLGLIYALLSNYEKAVAQFAQLVESPTNPSLTLISQAAQVFLDNYQASTDLYRACASALDLMERAITPYRDEYGRILTASLHQVWGFSTELGQHVPICQPDLALPLTVWAFDAEQIADPANALRQAGVTVAHTARLDVEEDGDDDWVVAILEPEAVFQPQVSLFLLLNVEQKLITLPVSRFTPKDDDLLTFRADTARVPDIGLEMAFVQAGSRQVLFSVNWDGATPFIQHMPSQPPSPTRFSHKAQQYFDSLPAYTIPEIDLLNQPAGSRLRLRWNQQTDEFLWDIQFPQTEMDILLANVKQAEQDLLVSGNASSAIEPLLAYLSLPVEPCANEYECALALYDRPRYRYLLGLAYELSGDEANAVQTYWQLWRDAPQSPYASLARAKLEPVNP